MSRGTQQSPWVYQATDYLNRSLTITVTFNNGTRALSGATVVRDVGCLYSKIYMGVGGDGKPDSTTRKVTVPEGTTPVSQATLNGIGLTTIEDIIALQITAGP